MIRPSSVSGVAFTQAVDGDLRHDLEARRTLSSRLEISSEWSTVRQVRENSVLRVDRPGEAGVADALWTTVRGLPVAVFTADCFGVVLLGEDAVGVAHCGWQGAASGVVGRLRQAMADAGHSPLTAALGPGIGPCCFEVGPEVAQLFEDETTTTSWGTTSVDLPAVIGRQLDGVEIWSVERCTRHEEGWFSHRRGGDEERLATLGWLP
jgi:YfiH family protein